MATQNVNEELSAINHKLNLNAQQMKTISTSQQVKESGSLWWRADNAMTISSVVLGFGVLVLLLATLLLHKTNKSSDSILQVFGTILIVVGAIFLVVAGYTQDQIGPVMGLLGTVAGYLLGKASQKPTAPPSKTDASVQTIP